MSQKETHLRQKERPEVGKETLLVTESQVMDLLRPLPNRSTECSVPAMASALAGSIKVMDTHANKNPYNGNNNNDHGKSKDTMFSITRHLTKSAISEWQPANGIVDTTLRTDHSLEQFGKEPSNHEDKGNLLVGGA